MKKVICIYGLPASGKTVQTDRLSKEFGFEQFGMGDRLRVEVESDSPLGQEIKSYLDQGILITDELMKQVIKNTDVFSKNQGVVFDGFPRMISQALMLEHIIKELDLELVGVFYLKVKPETAIDRIRARTEITHRSDDEDPEAVKNRFDVFAKESVPLLEYYKNRNALIEIDGELSIEEVFEEIKKHL